MVGFMQSLVKRLASVYRRFSMWYEECIMERLKTSVNGLYWLVWQMHDRSIVQYIQRTISDDDIRELVSKLTINMLTILSNIDHSNIKSR